MLDVGGSREADHQEVSGIELNSGLIGEIVITLPDLESFSRACTGLIRFTVDDEIRGRSRSV